MNKVIQQIHRIALLQAAGERTDGQLLESFVSHREAAALEALVRRHAPMVWGVCGRILHNHHDTEDAFQATFLVLVRKASTVRPREMVGNWLYGVARQTALKARATRAKRQTRERQVTDMPESAVKERDLWNDLLPVLDQELSRLPDKYRVAIILCDLEGKTRKEAARQLGCPEGTMAGRLTRARIMLAKRLTRRGVVLSGGALAAVLSQQAAASGVQASVASSTIKAATLLAAGKAAATGAISVKVATLTEGVMKAMLFTKLKTVLAVVMILGFMAAGATILTSRTAAGQEDKPPVVEKPVDTSAKQEPEMKEEEFAWGKEVNGLQLGLTLVPADKNAYCLGEQIKFEVRVRNVSKAPITISYGLPESEPKITDAKGEKVHVAMPAILDFIVIPTEKVLKPGETVALYQREVAVERVLEGKADPKAEVGIPTIRVPAGKYKIAFDEFVQRDLIISTGEVEFEVKDKSDKESSEKKEGFTAWGKEVGGVQAGLGYLPGQDRAYRTGETVRLVVRVRNVGKKEVKFSYFNEFFYENPPTVTDGEGKLVPLEGAGLSGLAVLVQINLPPGKEVKLSEMNLELRPASEKGKERPVWKLFGTGKFQMQQENVGGGNIGTGQIKFDPILSKLGTGKLELEVKDAEKLPEMKDFTALGKEDADQKVDQKLRVPENDPANEQLTKTLLALDKQLWDAAKSGDWKVYDRLLARDFIGHSAASGRSDKQGSVENVKNRRYSEWTIRDVETKEISKDVAILTYVYSCKVNPVADGTVEKYQNRRTSLVWTKRDGAWVLVFCQETGDTNAPSTIDERR
jgi:RNA polymerase sigma factor (sigma-70 family)